MFGKPRYVLTGGKRLRFILGELTRVGLEQQSGNPVTCQVDLPPGD